MKSPPELWTQCSDPASLARHLRGFGEIKITRLEPESTVAWEGESASGTVTLEAAAEVTPLQIVSEPALAPRGLIGLIGALRRRPREVPSVAEGKAPATPAAPELAESANGPNLLDELEAALDSLGQAHHRPYSRS